LKSNSLKKGQTDRGENGGHKGTIKVTFIEIRRTDRDQNGGHYGIIKVTFIEKKQTDRGQNDEHNVTTKIKMWDIIVPLKSYS